MPTTVTLDDLDDLDACEEQRELFASAFPDGITITPDNYLAVAAAAAEAGLNIDWYARHALTDAERAAYEAAVAPARAAYEASVAPAWAAYDEAVAPAWASYDEAKAEARAAYDEAVARALCVILAVR